MSNNLSEFKTRYSPEWYEDGPVKTFTREEIDEWERTCEDRVWQKYNSEMSLNARDRSFLDRMAAAQAEDTMNDIMQGVNDGEDNVVT